MTEISSGKLQSPYGIGQTGARWALSTLVLAVLLAVIAIPAFALKGDIGLSPGIYTRTADCATWSDAPAQFHRAKAIDDPVNGAWSPAEAEFYVIKYEADLAACTAWSEALAQFHRAKLIDDPVNGAWSPAEAEFYVTKYEADLAACTAWSEALARFYRAKPIDDPVNGAWSLAEAEFYVTKYGMDGESIVTLEENTLALLCDGEANSGRP